MAPQDGSNRSEAERVYAARQQNAAVQRDRERAREEWRDAMTIRRQMGPVVGFVIFMIFVIGTVLLARYGAFVWIIAAVLLIVSIALVVWRRRAAS